MESSLTRPVPILEEERKLNFYFHISLWCLKRFYEGLRKAFWSTTKNCENKNLSYFFILTQLSEMHGTGMVKAFRPLRVKGSDR